MRHDMPIDLQVLIDNRCSGSEYAIYLYIKHRLLSSARRVGLSLTKIKRGYNPDDYEGLRGISRDDIRKKTHYTLRQVKNAVDKLKALELAIPDTEDNGRYFYPVHFRLPFITGRPRGGALMSARAARSARSESFSLETEDNRYVFSPTDIQRHSKFDPNDSEVVVWRDQETDMDWRIRQFSYLYYGHNNHTGFIRMLANRQPLP